MQSSALALVEAEQEDKNVKMKNKQRTALTSQADGRAATSKSQTRHQSELLFKSEIRSRAEEKQTHQVQAEAGEYGELSGDCK